MSDASELDTLAGVSTAELLGRYAEILAELRSHGVVRTGNAPLGDYAEHVALRVYGGELAPNSAKSFDILSAHGRRIQVKARTLSPTTSPSAVFSAFRSFDFDVASFAVFDAVTYRLMWAREMSPEQVESRSRWSEHIRGRLLRISIVEREGVDVTDAYRAAIEQG